MIPTQPDQKAETGSSPRLVEIGAASAETHEGEFGGSPYKLLVTPEEAAAILSVGRTTIYELKASGQLESVHIKSCRRVPVAALERFVQRLLEDT